MGEAVAQKMCLICKTDCGGRPRVKDEHNRYVCRECLNTTGAASVEQALQAAQAAAVAYDDGIDMRSAVSAEAHAPIADLGEDKSCPKCSGFMKEDERICMRCGYDRKQKRAFRTRVEKAKDTSESRSRAGGGSGLNYAVMAVGAVCLMAGGAAFLAPEAVLISLLVNGVIALGTGVTVKICQGMDGDWGWFIAGFFIGIVDLIWVLQNHRGWLKILFCCSVIGLVLSYVALIVSGQEASF